MMRESRDVVETHHSRGTLNGMDQPKGLIQVLGAVGLSFEHEKGLSETLELLFGLVHEHREILRHLVGDRVTVLS